MRIGIVAPGRSISKEVAERVTALAAERFAGRGVALRFHPQCFLQAGHFAGDDAARADALIETANDPEIDAVWFAAGGYGACRLLDRVIPALDARAKDKTFLGYSDAGFLLGALYKAGCTAPVHGPMPKDIEREGGDAAVARALTFLLEPDTSRIERSIVGGAKTAAFNLTVLSHLIGTPYLPDLSGHVLMLEDVSEHLYAVDRALFHVTSAPEVRRVAGIRLGRVSDIPENDIPFGADEGAIVKHWCAHADIPYLGRADIGHDAENKIVPFGAR